MKAIAARVSGSVVVAFLLPGRHPESFATARAALEWLACDPSVECLNLSDLENTARKERAPRRRRMRRRAA